MKPASICLKGSATVALASGTFTLTRYDALVYSAR